jgi:hypothetical protein
MQNNMFYFYFPIYLKKKIIILSFVNIKYNLQYTKKEIKLKTGITIQMFSKIGF